MYPRLYLWTDPDATVVRAAREANAEMPAYTVGLLEAALGSLTGAARRRPRRVVPRRGQGDGFLGRVPTVAALRARGAEVVVHDPLYCDAEFEQLGFTPYHLGDPVDAAVVQTDHAEYRGLAPRTCPGSRCSSTAATSPTRTAGSA